MTTIDDKAKAGFVGLTLAKPQGWAPNALPAPRAHDPHQLPLLPSSFDESLYTTSSPAFPRAALTTQPEFFRLVVPPLFVDVPAPLAVGRFADSPRLRALVDAELSTLIARFSPARSIAATPAATIEAMPVVDDVASRLRPDHFQGWELLAVQHLYASTVGMIDAMIEHGLRTENATVIGKSYSTAYGAAHALADRGVRVPEAPLEQHPLESHDDVTRNCIRGELTRLATKLADQQARGDDITPILVLDEGGHVIELLHEEFPQLLPHVKAVEQTTRGIRIVDALGDSLGCPVVDVARAWVKLEGEKPLIGKSIAFEVLRKLIHLQSCGFECGKVVSLIGYGSVGRGIAASFVALGHEVKVFDPALSDSTNLPLGVTAVADRTEFLSAAHVLVSATGTQPITSEDYRLLPHRAALFNGASSNDELAASDAIRAARAEQPPRAWWSPTWRADKASYLRGLPELLVDREYALPDNGWLWGEFDGTVLPLGNVARRARRDRVLHFADKDVFLANSGFVVNLTDELDPIPARFIQVTRGALLAACAQAVDAPPDDCRAISLDEEEQQLIWTRYRMADAAGTAPPTWTPGWVAHQPELAVPHADALRRGAQSAPRLAPIFARSSNVFFLSPAHVLKDAVEK